MIERERREGGKHKRERGGGQTLRRRERERGGGQTLSERSQLSGSTDLVSLHISAVQLVTYLD